MLNTIKTSITSVFVDTLSVFGIESHVFRVCSGLDLAVFRSVWSLSDLISPPAVDSPECFHSSKKVWKKILDPHQKLTGSILGRDSTQVSSKFIQ